MAEAADWGGRGGLEQTGRTGADEADRADGGRIGSSLEGCKGRTGKPGAGVPADWADRLGCARPGQLASSRLRAKGTPGVLSPNADYGVIWLHTPWIHIRFFGAHIVVIFWRLTLRRRKEPLPVTSFLVRWELSTSRIPCSSKWSMPFATS